MDNKGAISAGMAVKIVGAIVGSIGFFFSAFGRTMVGAAFIGLGGVLLALGDKVG